MVTTREQTAVKQIVKLLKDNTDRLLDHSKIPKRCFGLVKYIALPRKPPLSQIKPMGERTRQCQTVERLKV